MLVGHSTLQDPANIFELHGIVDSDLDRSYAGNVNVSLVCPHGLELDSPN